MRWRFLLGTDYFFEVVRSAIQARSALPTALSLWPMQLPLTSFGNVSGFSHLCNPHMAVSEGQHAAPVVQAGGIVNPVGQVHLHAERGRADVGGVHVNKDKTVYGAVGVDLGGFQKLPIGSTRLDAQQTL